MVADFVHPKPIGKIDEQITKLGRCPLSSAELKL